MAIYVSETGTEFTPAPAGTHQGVCVDVVDLGLVKTQWGEKRMVRVVWQIDETMDTGKRFIVQRRYTASLNEKAALRHDLEAWRGRPFTADELKQFDVENVLSANALLNIVHQTKEGKTYANVKSLSPILKTMTKLEPTADYVRVQDREPETPAPQSSSTESYDPYGSPDDENYITDDDPIPF